MSKFFFPGRGLRHVPGRGGLDTAEGVFGTTRHLEFLIKPGADVDLRCTCTFVEFVEEGAIFDWNEACPVHPETPPELA